MPSHDLDRIPIGFGSESGGLAIRRSDAEHAQAAGKDDVATALYAKALQQDPAWTEGWWRYGGLLYEQHKLQDARLAFVHLTQLAPQNPLGFALLGLCEYGLEDWDNASLHLNKALNHGGLPPEIANVTMYDFGLVLMQQHNRNGAIIVFRLLQHQTPDYPDLVPAFGSAELNLQEIPAPEQPIYAAVLLEGQAAVAVLQLRIADAEHLYRQAIEQNPKLPFTHLCLALFLLNQGKEPEAEAELRAESLVNTATADPWVWLARLTLARRDATDARIDAERALRLRPNDGLLYLIIGRSFMIDQEWDKAMTALDRAEALAPDNYEVHYALTTVYSELHENEEAVSEREMFVHAYAVEHPAVESASQLTAHGNTRVTPPMQLESTNTCSAGDEALTVSRWQAAIDDYSECLKVNSNSFAVFSNMGVAYSHLGLMLDAVSSYTKALALDPSNTKIEFNLAITEIRSGDYASAADRLEHLQRSGNNFRYDELLAFCYYHLESYSLAARAAEKVYATHPDDAGNALILGSAYTRMGQYEKALPLITLALKAAGSAEGHLILAQTLLGMHNYPAAQKELNQVAAIKPDLPGLHTAMGDLDLGFDKIQDAEAEYALAIQANPNDFEANYLLGRLKRFDRDIPTAKKYLDKADQLHPHSAEVMYERAEIALSEQRFAAAVPLLEEVIKAQPDNAQAYLMLSESYQRTGRREEAQKVGELYNAKRRELHEKEAQHQQQEGSNEKTER